MPSIALNPPKSINSSKTGSSHSVHHNNTQKAVFEESIFNLLPKEVQHHARPPRHRSVYADMARAEYKASQAKSMGSIGPAVIKREQPENFLKKHTRDQKASKSAGNVASGKKEKKAWPVLWEPTKPIAQPYVKPDLNVKRKYF